MYLNFLFFTVLDFLVDDLRLFVQGEPLSESDEMIESVFESVAIASGTVCLVIGAAAASRASTTAACVSLHPATRQTLLWRPWLFDCSSVNPFDLSTSGRERKNKVEEMALSNS